MAPGVARGSLLAFDYRVLHAGNRARATGPWPTSSSTARDDAVARRVELGAGAALPPEGMTVVVDCRSARRWRAGYGASGRSG